MRARRVLLVNPPFPVDPGFVDYPYFTGLGVLANAAALREQGFSVAAADAQAVEPAGEDKAMVGCRIERLLQGVSGDFAAVVVGIPPYLKPHVRTPFAAGLFRALRSRFPSVRLVAADCYFGGMHYIEYDAEGFLRRYPEADAVVKYEGEEALPALLRRSPGAAPRVAAGSAAGIDMDALPFPAWDLISVESYQAFLKGFFSSHGRVDPWAEDLPTLPAVTSRGCAYGCAFCTANPGEGRAAFRPHGPAYLRRYFAWLKTRFGARRLALLDGCPNHDPVRFSEVLGLIRSLGLRCEFPNGLRADKLSFGALKTLRALSESVSVSAESADAEVLNGCIGKGLDIAAVDRVASWCRGLNLPLFVHYVVGFPGETTAGLNRTLAHALRMKERYGAEPLLQNFVPIPGSPGHELCVRRLLLSHFDEDDLYRHFQGPPAVGTPELPRPRLARMTGLFRRRLRSAALEKVIINLTYECSNNCRFCAVGDRRRRHGGLARYYRLLRAYRKRGVVALDIDGGEPTLHPRFFQFVRFARAAGYERVTVTTNGRRLADRAFASRVLLSGLTDVLVSLHGHDAATHEHHTRRKGSFQETVAGIRHAVRLKPERVGLAVNTTMTEKNAPHVADLFRFIKGLGVEKVNIQFVTPFGHAAASSPEDTEAIWRHLEPALARWRDRLRIQLVNAVPCEAAGRFAGLKPDVGKHAREMVFVDAPPRNLAAYLDRRRRKTAACRACEFSIGCAGRHVFKRTR